MFQILLLEDDTLLSATLQELLEFEGYEVCVAKNGNEAMDLSFTNSFDMYLLDVNVPFLNGFDFLKELRESGDNTPAFFITALRDTSSLSKGFSVGADDYIKKPFDYDELLIRINAKLKLQNKTLHYKDITYHLNFDTITKENQEISLQKTDKQMFLLLLKECGKVVAKERFFELMDKPTELALRVHISKIKKILGLEIENIRGIGYKLEKI